MVGYVSAREDERRATRARAEGPGGHRERGREGTRARGCGDDRAHFYDGCVIGVSVCTLRGCVVVFVYVCTIVQSWILKVLEYGSNDRICIWMRYDTVYGSRRGGVGRLERERERERRRRRASRRTIRAIAFERLTV